MLDSDDEMLSECGSDDVSFHSDFSEDHSVDSDGGHDDFRKLEDKINDIVTVSIALACGFERLLLFSTLLVSL